MSCHGIFKYMKLKMNIKHNSDTLYNPDNIWLQSDNNIHSIFQFPQQPINNPEFTHEVSDYVITKQDQSANITSYSYMWCQSFHPIRYEYTA